jgi:hypothetical protein
MRHLAVLSLLLASAPAMASWPTDITLSGMRTFDGVRAAEPTEDAYRALITDLGTAIANQPMLPAATTGISGWDVAVSTTVLFARIVDEDEPTHWQRAHPEGDPQNTVFLPTLTARKGLPWSTEIGMTAGWYGGSHQGVFGGFARVSPLEGYKPYPDLNLQVGYSGYINNDELDLGVLDVGCTIGTRFGIKRLRGVTFSQWAPFVGVSLLQVRASPKLDAATAAEVGALQFGGADADEPALTLTRVAGGFQITNNKALFRLAVGWVPKSVPTLTLGMGFAL